MEFPAGLRALKHRDYRLFLSGQLISQVGTWMQSVAQSWLVLVLTDSAFKLGIINALQFGPMLLFSLLAGAIADRVYKRRTILLTQTALMLQAFALALLAWTGNVQFWHVAVLAACYGLANTLDMPTRQSFVVEMVGKEDLGSAVALNSAAFNAARMLGPAVAGVLVARFGVAPAFALNGLSFVAVIGALSMVRAEGRPQAGHDGSVAEDIAAGVRYALQTPRVRLILSLLLAVGILVVNHSVMVPLLARSALGEGARGFGFLMASLGIGAMLGALAVAPLRKKPRLRLIVLSAAASSGFTLGLAAVRSFWPAAAVLALTGFSQIFFLACCNTALQLEVPDSLRGRIMSLYVFVFAGVTPIGAFLMGSLSEWFGVSAAYAAGGAAGLVCVAALAWSARPWTAAASSPQDPR